MSKYSRCPRCESIRVGDYFESKKFICQDCGYSETLLVPYRDGADGARNLFAGLSSNQSQSEDMVKFVVGLVNWIAKLIRKRLK
jgi:transposase-like protein